VEGLALAAVLRFVDGRDDRGRRDQQQGRQEREQGL
jgi:hypothetical protein